MELDAAIKAEPASDAGAQQWLVAGVNQSFAPIGRDDDFSTPVDTLLEGRVLTNDTANGFDIAAFLIEGPQNGEMAGLGASIYDGITPWGTFSYQPNPGFTGSDRFVYQVLTSASGAPSRYVTVRIEVTPE